MTLKNKSIRKLFMENEYKSERVSIRFSKEEKLFLEILTKKSNYKTLSEFLRNVIFSKVLDLNKTEDDTLKKINDRVARIVALTREIARKNLGKEETDKIITAVNETLRK